MKTKFAIFSILVLIGISVILLVPSIGYSFGEHLKEENYTSGDRNTGVILNTGVQNIEACHYYEFRTRIWNDPQGILSNISNEVILPKVFNTNWQYNSVAKNIATTHTGEQITETDGDNLTWLANANGVSLKLYPNSIRQYLNNNVDYTPYADNRLGVYDFTDSGLQVQKLTFSGLPNLNDGEYLFLSWVMQTGGNCVSVEKTLTSSISQTYNAGDTVEYKLDLKNTGGYGFKNLSVSDTFDSNTFSNNVVVESLDNPARTISNVSVNGSNLTFNIGGQFLIGQQTLVKLKFTVKPNFAGTHACNISGFVTYQDLQSLFNNRSDFTSPSSLCVNLYNPNPKLSVTKSVYEFNRVTNNVVYKIDVKNEGDVNFKDATVTDTFDSSKLMLVGVKEGSNNVTVIPSTNPNDFMFNVDGMLNANSTRSFLVTFNVKQITLTGKVCNYNVLVSVQSGDTLYSASYEPDVCIDYVQLVPGIKVMKYLINSSTAVLEYRIDVTNTGNTILKTVKLTDTYDDSRLVLASIVPTQTSNESGVIIINNILSGSDTLVPNETFSVNVKFNVKSNAPTGLACNVRVNVEARDEDSKVAIGDFEVPMDTVNCVNLIIIVDKEPYFSISKRLSSKTDTLVGDIATWEIVVRNICNGDNCKPATFLEFRDSFPEVKMTFNSAFAQLKNADGTNVNPNPIQFNPTSITSENGLTVIKYSDITELVGDITSGQYVVFTVYTTTKQSSNSCVLNTATAIGSTNSVSASACVNIGEVQGVTTVVTTILPKTDILDIFNTILSLPSNIQLSLVLIMLGLTIGAIVPSVLMIKSKRVE